LDTGACTVAQLPVRPGTGEAEPRGDGESGAGASTGPPDGLHCLDTGFI